MASQRVAHFLRVKTADQTPDFLPLCVEENKCRRVLKIVYGGKFPADFFLDIEADENNLTFQFFFELVNGGLYGGAANSEGGLEFQQDGFPRADGGFNFLRVVHQERLDGAQHEPGDDEPRDDGSEGEKIAHGGGVPQQDQTRENGQEKGDEDKGILIEHGWVCETLPVFYGRRARGCGSLRGNLSGFFGDIKL